MDDRKLYPMKFCSLQDEYSWGSETFKLADLGYRDSLVRDGWLKGNSMGEIMDTYLDRISGEEGYEYYGRQFPICVRELHVKGKMPLRVHPDDTVAEERYDFLGKEKLWYVLRAGKDACVGMGFRRDSNAAEVFRACAASGADTLMNMVAPHAGQCFHIKPGTVHFAQGDIDILEISQSSPMDFCLCAWGSDPGAEFDPSLTLVEALDFIDYGKYRHISPAGKDKIAECEAFSVSKMKVNSPMKCNNSGYDSFIIYSCVSGAVSVQLDVHGQTAGFPLAEGETMLIPAEVEDFVIVPTMQDACLLEVCSERKSLDSYTGEKAGMNSFDDI